MAFASPPWAGFMASAGISSTAAGSRAKRKASRTSLSFDDSERTYRTERGSPVRPATATSSWLCSLNYTKSR